MVVSHPMPKGKSHEKFPFFFCDAFPRINHRVEDIKGEFGLLKEYFYNGMSQFVTGPY